MLVLFLKGNRTGKIFREVIFLSANVKKRGKNGKIEKNGKICTTLYEKYIVPILLFYHSIKFYCRQKITDQLNCAQNRFFR